MRKTIATGAVAMLILASAFAYQRGSRTPPAQPRSTAMTPVTPIETPLETPPTTAEPVHEAPLRPSSPVPSGPKAERAQEASSATPEEGSAAPPAAMEPDEVRLRLSSRFQEERPDKGWTANAEALVRARLLPHLPAGSKLISMECRASMCEFVSAHSGPDSYNQFLRTAFQDSATRLWDGAGFATPTSEHDRDGNVITVAYLAREGHALPDVTPE